MNNLPRNAVLNLDFEDCKDCVHGDLEIIKQEAITPPSGIVVNKIQCKNQPICKKWINEMMRLQELAYKGEDLS